MAKEKKETEPTTDSTAVALIPTEFQAPVAFVLADKEKHLAVIKQKADEYALLTITDTTDKAGYDAVVKAMGEMKNTRLVFMKAAEDNVVGPAKEMLKTYLTDLEAIEKALKASEAELRKKKDFIDTEKVRIKAEAEQEKVRVMQVRVNDINVLGAAFDGKVYSFPYDQALMVTAADVKDLTAEEFTAFLDKAKVSHGIEEERINNAKAAKLLEEDKQKRQAEQNAEDSAKLKIRRTAMRQKELKMLGYVFNDTLEQYIHLDGVIPFNVDMATLQEFNYEQWDIIIHDIEHYEALVEEEPLVSFTHNTTDESPGVINALENAAGPVTDYGNSIGGPDSAFTIRSSNSFDNNDEKLEEAYQQDHMVEPLGEATDANPDYAIDVQHTEVILTFDITQTYTDSDISTKMFMRVFADGFKDEALAGIEQIANQGKFQDLNWVILPKTPIV